MNVPRGNSVAPLSPGILARVGDQGGISGRVRRIRASCVQWYPKYERVSAFPLFLMGLLFILAFGITVSSGSTAAERRFAALAIAATWLVFAVDYVLGLLISGDTWRFVRTHIMQGVALLFPPLRLLLMGHVFRLLKAGAGRSGDRYRTYLLYLTTLTLVVGAVMVVYFESKSANSNIHTIGDAIWWGGETISTVGYGDYYPVTVGGRIVAAVLFVNGVAVVSIITAGLAQNFVTDDAADAAADAAAGAADHAAGDTADGAADVVAEPSGGGPLPSAAPLPPTPSTAAVESAVAESPAAQSAAADLAEVRRVLSDMEASVAVMRARVERMATSATTGAASDTPSS